MGSVLALRLAVGHRFHRLLVSQYDLWPRMHSACCHSGECLFFFTFIYPAKNSAEQANHFSPPSINFQML